MVPKVGFVMFSFARSGTSMAMNLIGQHPDAFCHTEVFSKRPRAKPLQEAFVKVHGTEGRLEDPLGFARKVLKHESAHADIFYFAESDRSRIEHRTGNAAHAFSQDTQRCGRN